MCPSDPLACNELGVLTYKNQQYSAAEQWLLRALELVPGRLNAGQYAPHLVLDSCQTQHLSIHDGAAFCPSTHTNMLDARDDPFHSQEMGSFLLNVVQSEQVSSKPVALSQHQLS